MRPIYLLYICSFNIMWLIVYLSHSLLYHGRTCSCISPLFLQHSLCRSSSSSSVTHSTVDLPPLPYCHIALLYILFPTVTQLTIDLPNCHTAYCRSSSSSLSLNEPKRGSISYVGLCFLKCLSCVVFPCAMWREAIIDTDYWNTNYLTIANYLSRYLSTVAKQ